MSRTDAHTPAHHLRGVTLVTYGNGKHITIDMPTEWWETEGKKHYNENRRIRYEYMRHTPKWSRIMNRAKRRRDVTREIREQLEE